MNTPHKWILVEVGDVHKVFATWVGGYLEGDSWRINSGIESVEVDGDDHFLFHGYSGSIYRCHKDSYGTTGYGASVLAPVKDDIKVLDSYEQFIEDATK